MPIKRVLIILFFVFQHSSGILKAQETIKSHWFPEVRMISGFVVDHSSSMAFAIKKPVKSFQINILRHSNGRENWHQYYGFPITGFGYYYVDLGNPEVLGRAHSLFGIIDFPLVRKNNWSLNFNSGIGLSYFDTFFNMENNIYNSAMGSHINSYFDFSIDIQINVFRTIFIGNSFGLTHSSNGRVNTPNLGINLFTYRLAIRRVNYISIEPEKTPKTVYNKKYQFNIVPSFGIREREYPGGTKFFVHSIMFNVEKPVNAKGNMNAGIDFFYDSSIRLIYENDSIFNINYFDQTYLGAHAGYTVVFGQFSVIFQQGIKLYTNEPGTEALYQRIGANYKIAKHIIINFALKSYFAKAEFVELGIGFRW